MGGIHPVKREVRRMYDRVLEFLYGSADRSSLPTKDKIDPSHLVDFCNLRARIGSKRKNQGDTGAAFLGEEDVILPLAKRNTSGVLGEEDLCPEESILY